MHIMHVALGGCLKAPPVNYGLTQDTGGHIAYVLGAARAQVALDPAVRVTLVTRAFDEPTLGAAHALARERLGERLCIRRLRDRTPRYLAKSALTAELPALRRAFLALCEEDAPDVVHAHFADAAALALAARRRHRCTVLYTPHSLALDKEAGDAAPVDPARLARERRAIASADAIVVSSEDEVRRQVSAYEPAAAARCTVARPGIELRPSAGTRLARALIDPFLETPQRPLLLAIARPVPKKNLPMLLDAYGRSAALRRRANLVILAGQHVEIRAERDEQSAELDALHALVARHRLEGCVALPPSHAPETVTELYRLAARRGGVFVNPARHEPFGLTLIEAARFGLPVVATARGGPRDILRTLGHGRLVDPTDRAGLAAACEGLLGDAAEYAAARRSALARNGRYDWHGWASSVEALLGRLRAPQSHGGPERRAPATAARAKDRAASPRRPTASGARGAPDTHLLAFDIDDTLTGCAAGVERFRCWLDARRAEALPFAVATGRELPDALDVMTRWGLPHPEVWLTSVGTEIWRTNERGGLARCAAYARHLSRGWDRAAIVGTLQRSGRATRFQGESTQRPWKVSLFGDALEAAAIAELLARRAPGARVVASHGRFIDVIPPRAGKAAAIEFEGARRGIPLSRCVSAGNSGNDTDMLERCGRAILVANALPELVGGLGERAGLYRARERFAHGVLEGLAAFGLGSRSTASARRLPA